MKRGWLVALEGIDGSGKTTQLERLAAWLRERGHDVLATREPTDGSWGRRIREMARSGERVPPGEELRWFVEDRREHVDREIRPALEAGRVVLTDRYFLSTAAYQGARGLDPQRLLAEAEAAFPVPDLAIVLEIDPAVGLARAGSRGDPHEPAFEEVGFLRRAAEIFASLDRPWIARVDASGPPERVAEAIRRVVEMRLPDLARGGP